MSTRCVVIIKQGDSSITLYHHTDGYFQGVGRDLLMSLRNVNGDIDNVVNKLVKEGYEVTFWQHDDIEYMYIVDLNAGTMTVLQGDWWDNYEKPKIVSEGVYSIETGKFVKGVDFEHKGE